MSQVIKIEDSEQLIIQARQNNQNLFDTEASHDQKVQDKQFSPWVPKHARQKSYIASNKDKGSKDKTLQFLATIKSQRLSKTIELPLYEIPRQDPVKIDKDFRARAEMKFKQVVRKNLRDRQYLKFKTNFNPVLKQINLHLQCQNNTPSFNRSFDQRPTNMKEYLFSRKAKRNSVSQQRSSSQTSESHRYSIAKTKQIFYKTLQINLPITSHRKIPQFNLQKKKSHSIGQSFPLRTKSIGNRNARLEESIEIKEYNLMSQGITFSINERIRSRREKLRQHYQHEDEESTSKIFLN